MIIYVQTKAMAGFLFHNSHSDDELTLKKKKTPILDDKLLLEILMLKKKKNDFIKDKRISLPTGFLRNDNLIMLNVYIHTF